MPKASPTKHKKSFLRPSLARDYLAIIAITIIVVAMLAVIFGALVYHSHVKENNNRLLESGTLIERSLGNAFNYASYLMEYFGKQAQKLQTRNPRTLTKLLRGELASDKIVKDLFSWTLFDWLDERNRLTVSSTHGKVEKIVDMSFRSYAKKVQPEPWKIQFSEPAQGIPSGQWAIPAAMGITDKNGHFIGSIGMGFSIEALEKKIDQELAGKNISYVVLTNQYDIALLSADNKIERTSDFYKKSLAQNLSTYLQEGFLEGPISSGEIEYSYYRRITDMPFIILLGYNTTLRDKEITRTLLPLLSGFVIMGILVVFIAFMMRRWLVNPVVDLARAAEEIAGSERRANKVKTFIPRPKTRELHILAKQIVKVQFYFKRLHKVNLRLEESRDAALHAKEAAEEANNALQKFMGVIVHDICSPLSAAEGYAQLLAGETLGTQLEPQHKEFSLCIRKIIGDVIDIAHGLLGDMKDRATQVGKTVLPVEQILDEAVSILAQEARNKGLLIIKGYSNHSPSFLLSERKKILRIVLNILSNAIKYSEGGKEKRIWINTILDETRLEISIKDEGYGIADIRNIFRPFNGASAPNNAKVRSTGLGLYSTRILVEEDHGGVLIIESEKGRGTTVRCVFTAHME